MNVQNTELEGVLIIEPKLDMDARGYFFESFSQSEFNEKVRPTVFVQDNKSLASYDVMCGLHFQRPPFSLSIFVLCVVDSVLDVAVDIRKGSPTCRKHMAVVVTDNNHRRLYIPKGFAQGFAVLSETAVIESTRV